MIKLRLMTAPGLQAGTTVIKMLTFGPPGRSNASATGTAPLTMSGARALARRVTHGGNRSVPPQRWGMTVGQFNDFIAMCRQDYCP